MVVFYGCRWRSIKECEVDICVHHGFSYLTLGPFDYSDYLVPASENSVYIAISVSFWFSQSECGRTSCSYCDFGPCMISILISGASVGFWLRRLSMDPLSAVDWFTSDFFYGIGRVVIPSYCIFGCVNGTFCNILLGYLTRCGVVSAWHSAR